MEPLTDEEKAIYDWQIDVRDFGEEGQTRLKNSSALVSRIGGLGGSVALELAAAGIGKLILAHAGEVNPSDLNRQILMSYDDIGKSRVEAARRRLLDLNPRLEIEAVNENMSGDNAASLVEKVDIVFDCAPMFEERFAMNRECIRQGKPMIDAAMFSMEGQVTTIIPGETACLQCIYPKLPSAWKRKFPVFGAVSCAAACFAAMEGIKVLSGMGPSLNGKMLFFDMRGMAMRKVSVARRVDCPVCGEL
ncbi:MAG: HesA/MoeB/ThiF family protein [Candidatus Hydrogenedentota bacterium]